MIKTDTMNKRVFTLLTVALVSIGSWAHHVKDVVYTENAKFVIDSENLVSQEDFETDYGQDVSLEVECQDRSYYYVSYDIMACYNTGTRQSLATSGSKNCYRVYLENGNGSATEMSRPQNYYDDRWKTVSYAVVAAPGTKIKIEMSNLLTGDNVRNICVHKASGYGDDRPLLEEIARIEGIINTDGVVTEAKEDFELELAALKEQLAAPMNVDEINDMWATLNSIYELYMDVNTVNMAEWVTNLDFDGITPSNKQTVPSGWSVTSDRWMCRAADYNPNFSNTPFVQRSIPWKYGLGEAKIWKTLELPAGRYMFTMKAGAWKYINSAGEYDYDYNLEGMKLFVNGDTVQWPVVKSDWGRKVTVFANVKEGEPVVIGMMNPASTANLIGYDDGELRLLSQDYEAVEAWMDAKALEQQKAQLMVYLDSANVLLASDAYVYGKTRLRDSVAVYLQHHADGDIDLVKHDISNIKGEIKLFHSLNAEFKAMHGQLVVCRALYADESYLKGKAELGAAIGTAEDFIARINPEVRDSVGCMNQYDLLVAAEQAFYLANRSETVREVELNPTADTEIDFLNNQVNHGTDTQLNAGAWKDSWADATYPGLKNDSYRSIVIMRFNVKDCVSHVLNAKLTVTALNNNPKNRSIYLGYCEVNDWDEATVTAEDAGIVVRTTDKTVKNIGTFGLSKSIAKGGVPQTVEFASDELTNYINTQADADGNVTLMIFGIGQNCSVASRESDTKPVLYVEYDPAVDTGIASVTPDKGKAVDAAWYNLQGQRVDKPTKGVFIHGGKKVVVK